jgi:hypothetical protein
MTNHEKLKELLIAMEFITQEEIESRNSLKLMAYEIDNGKYEIDTDGLPGEIYKKVREFDQEFGQLIIEEISDYDERCSELNKIL